MSFIFHLFLGFITSFLGSIFPSMLSMTTIKISLDSSIRKAIWYSIGVSFVVIFQAYIGVVFSKVLTNNTTYLLIIQKIGIVIFFLLSTYFFYQNKESKKMEPTKKRVINGFLSGLVLSGLNMFAIPFYVGVVSFLVLLDAYTFNYTNNFSFVLGSSLGTFSLLVFYGKLASKIENKVKFLSKHIDLFLAVITGLIAIINLIDLLL